LVEEVLRTRRKDLELLDVREEKLGGAGEER